MSVSAIATSPAYSDPFVQQQQAAQPASQAHSAARPGSGGVSAADYSDAAHVSASAEVQQLAHEGANSIAIAVSTGLTVSEVDSDLGISTGATGSAGSVPSGQTSGQASGQSNSQTSGLHEAANAAALSASPASEAHHALSAASPTHTLSIKA